MLALFQPAITLEDPPLTAYRRRPKFLSTDRPDRLHALGQSNLHDRTDRAQSLALPYAFGGRHVHYGRGAAKVIGSWLIMHSD
jgi:hypothetical protein